jgi:NADH-quinone oxidoreductase subunit N
MTVPTADFLRVLPELILTGFGALIVLADPFLPRKAKGLLGHIALIGVLLAMLSTFMLTQNPGTAFHNLIVNDSFSIFFRFLLLLITALTLLASFDYLERERLPQGEFYALVLFAAVGMGLMVSANELVTFFVALETSSIATYVLIGFRRNDPRSNEASMKYFLLGSFATAILLYGVALLFGATGSTFLPQIAVKVSQGNAYSTLVFMGMGLLFVGLAFKVATAPFQVWTPDVYEGAPTPVTAFLSTGPKAAAFAAFLRIFLTALGPVSEVWFWVLWGSAVLTMLAGNLGALAQTNVKRMLAYSSIAHAGYILVAFAAGNKIGLAAILFYLAAYALMKLGAFAVVLHVSRGEKNQTIESYAGLHSRHPVLAATLTIFLLSLIGIPLTGGFLGKLYIIQAGLEAKLLGLVILLALNSVLSAGYYLKIVKAMYMDAPNGDMEIAPVPASLAFLQLARLSAQSLP